jgi:hypothetical protein
VPNRPLRLRIAHRRGLIAELLRIRDFATPPGASRPRCGPVTVRHRYDSGAFVNDCQYTAGPVIVIFLRYSQKLPPGLGIHFISRLHALAARVDGGFVENSALSALAQDRHRQPNLIIYDGAFQIAHCKTHLGAVTIAT